MINTQIYGFHAEGRTLCLSCAQRIYDDSLEMYLSTAAIQSLNDEDRPTYAHKGLLCDDCYNWIFQPEDIKESWWLVDPEAAEHIRLLAPFADFLESLQVDVMNLRNFTIG